MCIHRSKRTLIEIGDYLGCYFMDDRAPALALLHTARELHAAGRRPAGDVYFAFTTNEEIGAVGAAYVNRSLPVEPALAVEVGPSEPEYGTTVDGGPIVAYSDAVCVYDKPMADRLMTVSEQLGYSPQAAVLGAFRSDASHRQGRRSHCEGGAALPAHDEHARIRSGCPRSDPAADRGTDGLSAGPSGSAGLTLRPTGDPAGRRVTVQPAMNC